MWLFITLFAILRVLIFKGDGTVKGQKEKKSEEKKLLETPGLEPGTSRSEVKCVTDIPKHFT